MKRLPVLLLLFAAAGCKESSSAASVVPFTPLPAAPVLPGEGPLAPPEPTSSTPPAPGTAPAEAPGPGLEPPTPEELEAWRRWELGSLEQETRLLEGVDSPVEERRAGAEKAAAELREGAKREGLSLERALVIRERAWSVLAERSRLLASKAILSELESAAAAARTAGLPDTTELRRLRRQAAEDVRRFGRASESRAAYGDVWVDAVLREEARLGELYRAALQRPPSRP